MWFFSIFSFIKGFFTKSSSSSETDKLTFYFISGLVIFIGVLLVLNHFRVKEVRALQQKNAVAQQQIKQAILANQSLSVAVSNQQQTTVDSVNAVQEHYEQEIKVKKKKHQILQHKTSIIAQIHQQAQQQINQAQTEQQKEEIKKEEQNQISQVQIQTIWQAYCSATNQVNCPSSTS
jgi:hypothetical protein